MRTLTFPTPTTGNTRTDVCNAEWCGLYCDRQITDCYGAYCRPFSNSWPYWPLGVEQSSSSNYQSSSGWTRPIVLKNSLM